MPFLGCFFKILILFTIKFLILTYLIPLSFKLLFNSTTALKDIKYIKYNNKQIYILNYVILITKK